MTSGKLEKVEAYGHVVVRTVTDTVTGDRAVYVPETGIARVAGKVRITRGQNQLNGSEAEVDLKTGISRLLAGNTGRVAGPGGADRPEQPVARRPPTAPGAKAAMSRRPGQDRGCRDDLTELPGRPAGCRAAGRRTRCADKPNTPGSALLGGGGLVARGVGKTYRKRPVVRNVSIELRRGEAVGLLGPNGAGKTTTFYMIVGLVKPDTGSISLDGADITSLPMYRRARLGIGYLPQEASVFRGLNVEQNIKAALEVVEPDPDTRDMMCDELLAEFGIGHLRRTPSLALSGGERRRVEIARALATQPSYILLDEPLAGIDPIAVDEIRDLVGASEGPRHRRADHRPQRAGNAGDHRPRLHHARRQGADGGPARGGRGARRTCAAFTWGKDSVCRVSERSCTLLASASPSRRRNPLTSFVRRPMTADHGDRPAPRPAPKSRPWS